ncbi:MAG TPA: DUF4386 domain-containing protein, partial [Candidatus Acidoferrum sp.]|nr:DUF4386 domain-containing protein [Candidatus Acidoferrum sp.]
MNSTKKTARIAGLLYLVNGVTGFFSIIYVPGKLIVSEDAAATANNILASERLFRLGIVSELICAAEFVFLLWVLYRLLGAVNKTHASLMVILGLFQIPIILGSVKPRSSGRGYKRLGSHVTGESFAAQCHVFKMLIGAPP